MEGVLPLLARLPRRPEARRELGLHVAREAIWAVLFAGLAWFAWHGAAAWIIAGLLAAEIAITACDEFIENRIRVLPQNERVVLPTALAPRDYGLLSWLISAVAAVAAFWSLRDLFAWQRLRRASVSPL